MLVCAPPRMGKSLLAISQLLTWPHSVIVNDVKGELYAATAGYRSAFSDVYVIDFQGYGNAYDPLIRENDRGRITLLGNPPVVSSP